MRQLRLPGGEGEWEGDWDCCVVCHSGPFVFHTRVLSPQAIPETLLWVNESVFTSAQWDLFVRACAGMCVCVWVFVCECVAVVSLAVMLIKTSILYNTTVLLISLHLPSERCCFRLAMLWPMKQKRILWYTIKSWIAFFIYRGQYVWIGIYSYSLVSLINEWTIHDLSSANNRLHLTYQLPLFCETEPQYIVKYLSLRCYYGLGIWALYDIGIFF